MFSSSPSFMDLVVQFSEDPSGSLLQQLLESASQPNGRFVIKTRHSRILELIDPTRLRFHNLHLFIAQVLSCLETHVAIQHLLRMGSSVFPTRNAEAKSCFWDVVRATSLWLPEDHYSLFMQQHLSWMISEHTVDTSDFPVFFAHLSSMSNSYLQSHLGAILNLTLNNCKHLEEHLTCDQMSMMTQLFVNRSFVDNDFAERLWHCFTEYLDGEFHRSSMHFLKHFFTIVCDLLPCTDLRVRIQHSHLETILRRYPQPAVLQDIVAKFENMHISPSHASEVSIEATSVRLKALALFEVCIRENENATLPIVPEVLIRQLCVLDSPSVSSRDAHYLEVMFGVEQMLSFCKNAFPATASPFVEGLRIISMHEPLKFSDIFHKIGEWRSRVTDLAWLEASISRGAYDHAAFICKVIRKDSDHFELRHRLLNVAKSESDFLNIIADFHGMPDFVTVVQEMYASSMSDTTGLVELFSKQYEKYQDRLSDAAAVVLHHDHSSSELLSTFLTLAISAGKIDDDQRIDLLRALRDCDPLDVQQRLSPAVVTRLFMCHLPSLFLSSSRCYDTILQLIGEASGAAPSFFYWAQVLGSSDLRDRLSSSNSSYRFVSTFCNQLVAFLSNSSRKQRRLRNAKDTQLQSYSCLRHVSPELWRFLKTHGWEVTLPSDDPACNSFIAEVDNHVWVYPTKSRPRRLFATVQSGTSWSFLLKSNENLVFDARCMHFVRMVNRFCVAPVRNVRTHDIIPLSKSAGMVRFMDDTEPLNSIYEKWFSGLSHELGPRRRERKRKSGKQKSTSQNDAQASGGASNSHASTFKPVELFYNTLENLGCGNNRDRTKLSPQVAVSVLETLTEKYPSSTILHHLTLLHVSGPSEYLDRLQVFSSTAGVMSVVGYLLGLGDRHLGNLLLDWKTGEVVHIDFNVCLDRGKQLRVPETVPFRWTPLFEGFANSARFMSAMADTLTLVQRHRKSLLAIVELDFAVVRPEILFVNSWSCDSSDAASLSPKVTSLQQRISDRAPPDDTARLLTSQATSLHNLAVMYEGWCPWI